MTHVIDFKWSTDVAVHARALLLAGDTLFLAGPPVVADEIRAYENWGSPEADQQLAAQAEAIAGKRGAKLVAVNKHDGKTLSETNMSSPPVFDGMIAAHNRLYLATVDGRIVCFAEERTTVRSCRPYQFKKDLSHSYTEPDLQLLDIENYDLRPKPGSPLVDGGEHIPGFTDGFKGKAPDIGAYKHCGKHWIPGITWNPGKVLGYYPKGYIKIKKP